jgi:hypothetical protein
MPYKIKIEDENGAVVSERELEVSSDHDATRVAASRKAQELALDAIHHAAMTGRLARQDASAMPLGAASIGSAARI